MGKVSGSESLPVEFLSSASLALVGFGEDVDFLEGIHCSRMISDNNGSLNMSTKL